MAHRRTRHRFAPRLAPGLAPGLAVGIVCSLAASAFAAPFGFNFYLGNSNTAAAAGDNFVGTRFTADRDMLVDTLHINLNNGSGTMELALQADDGFGNPSGVDLTGTTATAAAGWYNLAVPSVSLSAGQVYHLIVRNPTGSAGTRVLLGSKADVYTHTGQADPNAAQVFSSNNGSTWAVTPLDSRATVWGVSDSTSGDVIGQGYNTSITENFGAHIYRGQTFRFDASTDSRVAAMTVHVTHQNGTVGDDVRIHLVDASDRSVLYSATLFTAGTLAPGASDFFTVQIDEGDRPLLEVGGEYMIAVESSGSSETGTYNFRTARNTSQAGALFEADYQGTVGHHAYGVWGASGPTTLSSIDSASLRHDSFFVLDVTPVPEPATLGLIGLGGLLIVMRRRAARP